MKRSEITEGRAYAVSNWRSVTLGSEHGIDRVVITDVPAAPRPLSGRAKSGIVAPDPRNVLGTWKDHLTEKKARQVAKADAERAKQEEMARREAAVPLLPAYAPLYLS